MKAAERSILRGSLTLSVLFVSLREPRVSVLCVMKAPMEMREQEKSFCSDELDSAVCSVHPSGRPSELASDAFSCSEHVK